MYLRQKQNLAWKDIFFKFYARLCDFSPCVDCGARFIAAEMSHCSFHPMTPKYTYGHNQGYFPCCNSQALRFNATKSQKKYGCTSKKHALDYKSSTLYIGNTFINEEESVKKCFELLEAY